MTDWPDSSLSGVSHSGNPNPEGAKPGTPPVPRPPETEAWDGSQIEERAAPLPPKDREPGDQKEE